MKKLAFLFITLLVLPVMALAEDPRKELLREIHQGMFKQHELCVLYARTALSLDKPEAGGKLSTCIEEAKSDVEDTSSKLAELLKGNTVQTALASWRQTWLSTYESANLQANDTSETYLRRAVDTLKRTDKASDKFTAAVLKSRLY